MITLWPHFSRLNWLLSEHFQFYIVLCDSLFLLKLFSRSISPMYALKHLFCRYINFNKCKIFVFYSDLCIKYARLKNLSHLSVAFLFTPLVL